MTAFSVLIAATSPADFGPIYAETDMSHIPVEPWSTYSNLAFLAICIYWTLRLRGQWRRNILLTMSIPGIFAGFVGGAIYHATRSHSAWLLLDYLPIMILILAAAIYFWRETTGSWTKTLLATFAAPLAYRIVFEFVNVPDKAFIAIGYSVLALTVCIPAVLHCCLKNPDGAISLILSATSFAVAIAFHQSDFAIANSGMLPQGSHFLWHIFGACSAFFLMRYLYSCAPDAIPPMKNNEPSMEGGSQ